MKFAAVGDIHVNVSDRGHLEDYFKAASEQADVLLLCGDLTNTGKPEEAKVLCDELKFCTVPVVAVLGNHDHDQELQGDICEIVKDHGVHLLNGESVVFGNVGIAGVKGFGGGFDNRMLSMFGEKSMKEFVQETVDEVLHLDAALTRLDSDHQGLKKVVIMHYAPVRATVVGEPEEIFPFLGCSRLAEPLDRKNVDAVFHGHAHIGTMRGTTREGCQIFNVSKPILEKEGYKPAFFVYEIGNE